MMPIPDILGDVCWIAATVGSFLICRMIYQRLGQPLLHPVLWSTMLLVVLIGITHHPLSAYRLARSGTRTRALLFGLLRG